MANKKTLKVFSTAAVAGMMAAAVLSSQAFAAVNSYSVKVGDSVYKYDKAELTKAFLQAKTGDKSALYDDFTSKLSEAKGFYAFEDSKNGYVDYSSIQSKFLEAKANGKTFDVDAFTESKDAKVVEIATVKKAVVNKDGKVVYEEEGQKSDGTVAIKSVEALNLKQVKINFVKPVKDADKIDDIEDEDNYTLQNSDKDELKDIVDKVEMDESGKYAILTFSDDNNFESGKYQRPTKTDQGIVNQEKYKLIIDENVAGEELTKELTFKDFSIPEVEDIKVVGNDTIKVKFSEPVRPNTVNNKKYFLDDESFKINNDDISVNEAELVNDNKEVNIKLGSTLKDGQELKVEVRGTIEDYAGLGVKSQEKKLTVKKDTAKPEVVGFKKAKKGEVTLIFNRDIRFKDTDDKIKTNGSVSEFFDEKGKLKDGVNKEVEDSAKLKDFYHTSNNKAFAAKVDGKELTLYFDEKDDGLPRTAYMNIKSGNIETLWDEENDKIVYKVEREEDNSKPQVKTVEQDKDDATLIKVKFNKELDYDEATDKDNYTLKDSHGDKVTINKIEYKNSDKEVQIFTTRKPDSGKYKLTIDGVEDKYGNTVEKVTKEFNISEKDAVVSDDLKVNVYNDGENDQKIVVDFDTKMNTDKNGKYSITDLSKYTLVAKESKTGNELSVFKGNKSSVNVADLYHAKAKSINDGNKIEISLPYKSNKDDSYNLKFENNKYTVIKDGTACGYIELQVGKVADVDGNVNNTTLKKGLNESIGTIDVKKNQGDRAVRAISTDEIQVVFKDKMNLKNEDVTVLAVPQALAEKIGKEDSHSGYLDWYKKLTEEEKKEIKKVEVANRDKDNKDGKTTLTIKLSKGYNKGLSQSEKYDDNKQDHVMNYDGTIGDEHRVLFVKLDKGESKNDYDAQLTPAVHKVLDNIAPALVDNNKRDNKHKFINTELDKKGNIITTESYSKNKQNAVEFYRDGKSDNGCIVLTFEEDINNDSITRNTFKLDSDGDYKFTRIDNAYVSNADKTKVVIEVSGLQKTDDEGGVFGNGFKVTQNAPIEDASGYQFNRGRGNEISGISTEIGDFSELNKEVVEKLTGKEVVKPVDKVDKAALNKAIEEASKKVEKDYTAESWKPFAEALKNAQTVAKDDKADQKAVNDATKALSEAKLDKKPEVKPTENQLVAEAKSFMGKEYVEVTLPKEITKVDKVMMDGTELTAEKISVEDNVLSIVKANAKSKLQVVVGDKTYTIIFK